MIKSIDFKEDDCFIDLGSGKILAAIKGTCLFYIANTLFLCPQLRKS